MTKTVQNRIKKISRSLAKIHRLDKKYLHFTFVVFRSTIITIGINNPNKTTRKNLDYDYDKPELIGIHSEMDAICKLRGFVNFKNFTFVNIRLDKNNEIRLSKPCTGCQSLLKTVGFKKIFYTTNEGKFVEL